MKNTATEESSGSNGIRAIEHLGVLIKECSLEGERTRDKVVPAHPSAIQMSSDRWLILYATRMFRGTDDDTSIVYQIRENDPNGRLIKEGMAEKSINDWDPLGDGRNTFVKQHGHPSVFGVPKGAIIDGREAKSAGVFSLLWRMVAREYVPETGLIEGANPDPELIARTTCSEWMQVRLNDKGDDLEILQSIRQLRQKGYGEAGTVFCEAEDAINMSQGYTPPVPLNRECTEWTVCNHFDQDRFAALRFTFNENLGLYEWTETGPFLFAPGARLSNASLARYRDSWVCGVRTDYIINHVCYDAGLQWVRMDDPFSKPTVPVHKPVPAVRCPIVASYCPDGVLRLFSSDPSVSPYKSRWDPLYSWDIDPDDNFNASNRRVIFDTVKAGLPIRREAMPKADMCKPLIHNGNEQYILHRVSLVSNLFVHVHTEPEHWVFPPVNDEEIDTCGIYCAKITYHETCPQYWEFADGVDV